MAKTKSLAPKVGRPRAYEPEALRKAVERYFRSIGRTVRVTELEDSGEVDKYGHPVMVPRVVLDDDGEEMRAWEFAKPPTVGGLCRYLGIHRSTWSAWAAEQALGPVVEWARDVMQEYLEQELLTREGKNTRGVEFMLSANYGLSEQKTVHVDGPDLDMSALSDDELRRIAAEIAADDTEKQWEELTT